MNSLTIARITMLRALIFTAALGSNVYAATLRIDQLNWLDEYGDQMIPCSRVGVVKFEFDPLDALLASSGGGFLNVVTSVEEGSANQWSVQNLYLNYPSVSYMLASAPAVQFDLTTPDGFCASRLEYNLLITSTPLASPPPPAFMGLSINLSDYHVGGFEGGGSGLSDTPYTIGPWIGCSSTDGCLPASTANIPVPLAGIPAVNEGKNGCAPGAVARSIAYLYPALAPGVQAAYDDLYRSMNTDPASGTTGANMLAGKNQYVAAHGLHINSGFWPWGDVSEGELWFIIHGLELGYDIEIIISWDTAPPSGHTAMITSITKRADGSYQIQYVDDPAQGDGQAENKVNTIIVDTDGKFTGGQVWGFLVERRTD